MDLFVQQENTGTRRITVSSFHDFLKIDQWCRIDSEGIHIGYLKKQDNVPKSGGNLTKGWNYPLPTIQRHFYSCCFLLKCQVHRTAKGGGNEKSMYISVVKKKTGICWLFMANVFSL